MAQSEPKSEVKVTKNILIPTRDGVEWLAQQPWCDGKVGWGIS